MAYPFVLLFACEGYIAAAKCQGWFYRKWLYIVAALISIAGEITIVLVGFEILQAP